MNRAFQLLAFSVLAAVVATGCGDETGAGAGGSAGTGGSAGAGGTASVVVNVTDESFECILDGTPIRRFYVRNLLGDDAASVAVANGEAPLPYPAGTLIQLVPQEAMVKREAGFSEETADWEFFFLNVSAEGTEIQTRGKDETVNAFGGNCFNCHQDAQDDDFICETTNGCVELPLTEELIRGLQSNDPRCE